MNLSPWHTATELAAMYRSGEVSPVEVVEAALERAEFVEPAINSMVTTTADDARAQARAAELRFRSREDLPALFGIPVTVKDLVDTAGVRTTYGSTAYASNIPDTDAIAWARLKAAGTILLGKSTTPEFGLLGVTESHLTGSTSTPWARGHSAGGSSGGAAAGLAAGITPLAWGSDGGGSIRVPASLCGVVGIKPSAGRIPHAGNTDGDGTEGPMARTVLDAALMLDATAGYDSGDRFSIRGHGEVFADAAKQPGDLVGWRIGATVNPDHGPIDPEVQAQFEQSLTVLRDLGAIVEPVALDLPNPYDFFISYWGADFQAIADELSASGSEVWPSILGIAEASSALTPQRVSRAFREDKTRIYNAFARAFSTVDVIVTPTTPTASFPHCGDTGGRTVIAGSRIAHPGTYLHRLTEPPSHAGAPAISVPCGFDSNGLPVGLQFIAPVMDDSRAIAAAARFEAATPWHTMRPVIDVI